ncbi:MAG: carbohydrate ABC transporter permease [Bifidobacteriaceae bacterium]|jgi:raffinose/stachyose/melibiose transport system permease protein|nr:carbohydrate ABC transporter permease [Bifidobacteriaceae bacterium]
MKILGRPALFTVTTLCVIWVLPLVALIVRSLGRSGLENYSATLRQSGIARALLSSFIITATTVVAVLAVAALAGFAFSRLRFPFRTAIYSLLLTGLMLPSGAILVPFAELNKAFGWGDTYAAVIFPYIALFCPLGLLLMKGAYDALPEELFEAAVLDGCGVWGSFRSVALPLTGPALSVVGLWTFLSTWNEFLLALLFLHDPAVKPISVIPLGFQQRYFVDVPKIFAALVISQIPVVLAYILMQKRFNLGMLAGVDK